MTREEFLSQLPGLAKSYKPAPDVVAHIGAVDLLMVVGPSGVGKTSIINGLGINYVAGDTTRDIRPDEQDGVDYHFRKDYEKIIDEIKNGSFVQVAIGSGGDFYATKDSSYPESGAAVMAVVAQVVPVFRNLGYKSTPSVFITPPSLEEWMKRLQSHELKKDQYDKRISEARSSLAASLDDAQIHFVLNDNLDKAVKQIKEILAGKTNVEREKVAKQTAQNLLDAIK